MRSVSRMVIFLVIAILFGCSGEKQRLQQEMSYVSSFNDILKDSWASSNGSWDKHWRRLHLRFGEASKKELVGYWKIYNTRVSKLFTDPIYNGAYLVMGGALGNDGFLEFTDKVAIIPSELFESILSDANYMAEVSELEEPAPEMFSDIFVELYDRKIGARKGREKLYEINVESANWEAIGNIPLQKQDGIEILKRKYASVLEGLERKKKVVRGQRRR